MRDEDKSKSVLIKELNELRRKLSLFESTQLQSHNNWLEAEDLYMSLIADALFGYYVVQDNLFRFANPRLSEIFGYRMEEMLENLTPLDIVHPDDKLLVASRIESRLNGEASLSQYIFKGLKKDGGTLYIHIIGSRIMYRGRLAIHGNMLDITEQVMAEEALRRSEQQYRSLVENHPDLICRYLPDGTLTFVNQAYCRYYKTTQNQMVGLNFLSLMESEEREAAIKHLAILNAEKQDSGIHLKTWSRSGKLRYQQWITRALTDQKGQVVEYQGVGRDTTQQIMTEEAIRESERNLRERAHYLNTLIDNMNELFFTYDLDSVITFSNRKSFEVIGYHPDEMIGLNVLRLVPEVMRDLVRKGIKGLLDHGIPESFVIPISRKDGIRRWLQFNSATIVQEDRIIGAMVLGEDVTERRNTEKALRNSENNLRKQVHYLNTLIDNLNELFYTFDLDQRITFINKKSWDVLGYRPEELVGQKVSAIIPANDNCRFIKEIIDKGLKGRIGSYEISVLRKDEKQRLVRLNVSPIYEDGQIVGGMSLAEDISERKKTEQALVAETEKLAVTLRSIGEGVISINTNGEILMINDVAEKLTGWTQADAMGKHLNEVLHLIDPKTRETYKPPSDTPETVVNISNLLLTAKDGTERIIDASGSRILDREGRYLGVVLVLRDITEKLKIEEELLKASKLDSVGILAGGIAHDFNNLLMVILGNITLAKIYSENPEDLKELLLEAENASLQAKSLTQQLLTFARGGTPIKKTTFIGQLIQDTVNLMLSGSNAKREFRIPPDLWSVDIDEGQISQVINNLVINALQAMPQGGVIKVAAENVVLQGKTSIPLKNGNYVLVTIEDQGIGIPAEIHHKIFDPYYTTKPMGSGLGLATSYSIIHNHDGYIGLESNQGPGTTVYIYLPASLSQPVDKLQSDQQPLTGQGRILVLDDEPRVRITVANMLNTLGYEAVVTKDGAETIDLYYEKLKSGQPFDAVIMDLTIPGGIGGKEVVLRLKEIDPEVKAIVSSGYSNDPIMSNHVQGNFQGVIAKPYSIYELSRVLKEVLTIPRQE